MNLDNMIEKAEQYFLEVVETGTDQQLFIAGYVQGHFTLALSQLQSCEVKSSAQLKSILNANLEKAFADNELEVNDQQQSKALVEQLFIHPISA